MLLNRQENAIGNYHKALYFSQKSEKFDIQAQISKKLAELYIREGNEEEAIKYYKKELYLSINTNTTIFPYTEK